MGLLPKNRETGWLPYVWLIYMGYFLAFPFTQPVPVSERLLTGAAAVVFLALYFRGHWLRGPGVLWVIAGITALGVLCIPRNPGASVFFIYAASFGGRMGKTRHGVYAIAGVLAVLAVEIVAVHLPVYAWFPAVLFSLLVGGVNLHQAEVSRGDAKLRATQEEVERLAQTAERERIGRDLHDLLGHTLSLVTLKAELARKLVPRDPERAAREMEEVERISRDALREVRAVVSGYRTEGLMAEMARARLALEAAGIGLEYLALPVDLDPARETVLAMALREAVTNVVRHAGARTCRISLEPVAEGVRLEVRDDGKGGGAPDGMGLSVMRDRVEGMGGSVERRGEGGTVVVITLPKRQTPAAMPAPAPGGLAAEGAR
jgi:two-component system sensor histidine kinase DesK